MVAICLTLILTCGAVAMAQDNDNGSECSIILDGKKLEFDQSPINIDGNILVPMRPIFEACDAEVTWVGGAKPTVYVRGKNSVTIEMYIGEKIAYVNGDQVTLSVAPMIYNNRTMVPVRFVAETLGATVEWIPPNVVITTNMSSAQYILIPDEPKTEIPTGNAASTPTEPAVQPAPVTPVAEPAPTVQPVTQVTPTQTTQTQDKTTDTPEKHYESALVSCEDYLLGAGNYYHQDGIKGACYITSLGMLAANLTGVDWPAAKVYEINNNSVIGGTEALFASLGIKRDKRIYFEESKKSTDKVKQVVELLKNNPEGVIVKFESDVTTHFVVVRGIKDGKLVINDPANDSYSYVSLEKSWTGKGMFDSYDEAIAHMVLVEYFSKA